VGAGLQGAPSHWVCSGGASAVPCGNYHMPEMRSYLINGVGAVARGNGHQEVLDCNQGANSACMGGAAFWGPDAVEPLAVCCAAACSPLFGGLHDWCTLWAQPLAALYTAPRTPRFGRPQCWPPGRSLPSCALPPKVVIAVLVISRSFAERPQRVQSACAGGLGARLSCVAWRGP
jgi:hypothetical protein